MEVKVGKIDLSVTNNGTPKVSIYPEGADFNNQSESIEIIGEEVIYVLTRKVGETIEITERGKWKNIVIPQEYTKALNSPTYDRIKLLFRRGVSGVNKAVNGSRTQIDLETAKLLIAENLDVQLKVQNYVLELFKSIDTPFTKQILDDLKSKDVLTKYNAWKVLTDYSIRNIMDISKDYSIINDGEEVKVSKK